MAGQANFPTALDDDTSLIEVVNNVTALDAPQHNNMKEAIKAIEAKLGIYGTSSPTSLDYRLGHPSFGHSHDGASGQGPPFNPSAIFVPSGGYPSGGTLHDHLRDQSHSRFRLQSHGYGGFDLVASHAIPPIYVDRTVQIESIVAIGDKGPSGGTSAWDVNLGPTSLWYASQGNRIMFFATSGFARATMATTNIVTIPSGSMLHIDLDTIPASNRGVYNPSIIFVFRE